MSSPSIFSLRNFDLKVIKGDNCSFIFECYDENGAVIDLRTNKFEARFTLKDPLTENIIQFTAGVTTYSKNRNEFVSGGNGVYFFGDSQLAAIGQAGTLTAANQLLVMLSYTETKQLREIAYDYDIELGLGTLLNKFTLVKGRFIVASEATVS